MLPNQARLFERILELLILKYLPATEDEVESIAAMILISTRYAYKNINSEKVTHLRDDLLPDTLFIGDRFIVINKTTLPKSSHISVLARHLKKTKYSVLHFQYNEVGTYTIYSNNGVFITRDRENFELTHFDPSYNFPELQTIATWLKAFLVVPRFLDVDTDNIPPCQEL